jgi:6-pyruvoyltetrahydropterin/6-carboxytetrahydropterin synthase
MQPESRTEIVRKFGFEAAHRLPNVQAGHQCSRLHGHSYKVQVGIRGTLNSHHGWVIDLTTVADQCEQLVRRRLEHQYLNEIPGLQNPTVELLAAWIFDHLSAATFEVAWVDVQETERSSARVYARGEQPWHIG